MLVALCLSLDVETGFNAGNRQSLLLTQLSLLGGGCVGLMNADGSQR